MNITLYKFSKPDNSTKIPTSSTPSATYACNLKENVSIMTPVIEFAFVATSNPSEYNYMYIPEFKRYYFIDNWGYNRRVWVCNTHVDVLASFRADIFDKGAYILRSVFKQGTTGYYFDSNIRDSMYPATTDAPTYSATSMINILNAFKSSVTGEWLRDDGVYVIGTVSDQSTSGAVTYYAFSPTEFASLMSNLFGSVNWADIPVSEISQGLQKALINPFQYIVSCSWCPFAINPAYGQDVNRIRIGWTTFSANALMIRYGASEERNISLTIPRHPQSTRGQYLNTAPYAYYTLKFYPFGTIDIDAMSIVNYNTLDLYCTVDICSGEGILTIAVNNRENPIRQIKAQVLVPIPVAQIAIDISRIGQSTAIAGATGLVQAVAGGGKSYFNNAVADAKNTILGFGDKIYNWITGSDIATETGHSIDRPADTGTIHGTVSSIVDAAAASSATVEMHGGAGSRSGYVSQNLSLSGKFFTIAPENIWDNGRPLCKIERIGDMQGYIQTDKVSLDITSGVTVAEKTAIESYLQGGCYIE